MQKSKSCLSFLQSINFYTTLPSWVEKLGIL